MLWTGALRIKARDIESVRARARAHIASRPRPRVLFDERRGTQRSEFNRSTFFWCCRGVDLALWSHRWCQKVLCGVKSDFFGAR